MNKYRLAKKSKIYRPEKPLNKFSNLASSESLSSGGK